MIIFVLLGAAAYKVYSHNHAHPKNQIINPTEASPKEVPIKEKGVAIVLPKKEILEKRNPEPNMQLTQKSISPNTKNKSTNNFEKELEVTMNREDSTDERLENTENMKDILDQDNEPTIEMEDIPNNAEIAKILKLDLREKSYGMAEEDIIKIEEMMMIDLKKMNSVANDINEEIMIPKESHNVEE